MPISLIVRENDQRVENLLGRGKIHEAAELCFCLETSRAMKINVIQAFIETGKVKIKGDALSLLSDRALKSLLRACMLAKTGKAPQLTVSVKTPQRRIWHYVPYRPSQ